MTRAICLFGLGLLAVSCTYVTHESMYATSGAASTGDAGSAFTCALTAPSPATNVPLGAAITLRCTGYPDPASASGSFGSLLLMSGKNSYDFTATVDLITQSITMQPRAALTPVTGYVVEVTASLRSLDGRDATPVTLGFTTGKAAGGGPPAPKQRTLATDVQPLFDATCATAGCHTTLAMSGGLDLTRGKAAASLVGVDSSEVMAKLVAAGDPASSYLVHKLLPTPDIVLTAMPNGSKWSIDNIRVVSDWIATGAMP